MATPLKVYGGEISQPTRAVTWFCEIAHIPYELIQVNVTEPRSKRADYVSNINPNGRIPAIKDTNGLVVYEAPAILQYLCHQYKVHHLYPSNLKHRAKVDEYLHWHHEHSRKRLISTGYVGLIMRIDVPFKRWILGTDLFQRRKTVQKALEIIENHRLGVHAFVAGDTLSIADILCYEEVVQLEVWNLLSDGTDLGFGGDGAMYLKQHYPNISQWLVKMQKLRKHDEIHAIMVKDFILNHVRNRRIAFAKELERLKPKL